MIGTVENAVPIAGGQMKGISSLNDFHFEPTGIRAWKQSKIGEGKLYNIERRTQPAIFVGCIVKPGRKIPLAEKTKTDCPQNQTVVSLQLKSPNQNTVFPPAFYNLHSTSQWLLNFDFS